MKQILELVKMRISHFQREDRDFWMKTSIWQRPIRAVCFENAFSAEKDFGPLAAPTARADQLFFKHASAQEI